jgi:two-component system phosphate regulon sensor histidine kinase PhoR
VTAICVLLFATLGLALVGWARDRRGARRAARRFSTELAQQRAQRDAELREQSQRTAALFDRMVEGLIVVDATGAIRLANRSAGALFEFPPPAAGRTLLEVVRHHEVAALAARLGRESEVLGYELRIEALDATRFLQINALALRDRDGRHDGAILVFHDLTRIRQLEAVRQEFVANVSHELRTPLSLIKSAVETLIDGAKSDPATLTRFLEIIDRHASRLTLLIDDLLLLSTLDSGRIRLQAGPLSLRPAVQEVMDDFQVRARARGIVLANEVPGALVAQADPDRLRQVISNLIDNAIKYGRPDGRVSAQGEVLADGRLELGICDDGPGIPAEMQARVFERFYRVDKARSREQGGTGLGLAIVKHVVQAHGGDVRVVSAAGAGTSFYFTLPAALAA